MVSSMRLNLKSHRTYLDSFKNIVAEQLAQFYGDRLNQVNMQTMLQDAGKILRHPRLDRIDRRPQNISSTSSLPITNFERHASKLIVLQGLFFSEHTVGGLASRLNKSAQEVRFGQKFRIRPAELVKESGLINYSDLIDISLGERHMLQYAFALYTLARDMGGEHWSKVLKNQQMLIIPNKQGKDEIIDSFHKNNFFGFDPNRVLFSDSVFYDGLYLENGQWLFDEKNQYLHNHGIVPLQTCMGNTIYTLDANGREKKIPRWQYRDMLGTIQDKVSYNIEDLDYLLTPIDYDGIARAMQFAQDGYRMVMEIFRQKHDAPKKGGMLCFDPDIFDPKRAVTGRQVVIESSQLDLPPENISGIKNPAFTAEVRTYSYLNRNFNHYPFPQQLFDLLAVDPLQPLPEIREMEDENGKKTGAIRIFNCAPQGDINSKVPTAYVIRDTELKGLKEIKDIPDTLKALRDQDNQKGFKQFISEFPIGEATQQFYPDLPFAFTNNLSKAFPLEINTFLSHPWFTQRTHPKSINKLKTLSEVFKVEGSIIYHVRLEGDSVKLKVLEGSQRGMGKTYPSQALKKEVEARDIKKRVVKEDRIWTGQKKVGENTFSYILINNLRPEAEDGELIMLLGSYKEDQAVNQKVEYLGEKLNKVLAKAMERGVYDKARQTMQKLFKTLPWQFLFENGSDIIEQELERQLETLTKIEKK